MRIYAAVNSKGAWVAMVTFVVSLAIIGLGLLFMAATVDFASELLKGAMLSNYGDPVREYSIVSDPKKKMQKKVRDEIHNS